ncbi:MAG: ABC transporter permease [Carbonactinosporaceae bacterium]
MSAPGSTDTAPASLPLVAVQVPEGSLRRDLRAVKIVWQRDLIRFLRDRARIVVSLLQPVLFLFVLGTGLSSLVPGGTGGVDLRTFIFPGAVSMAVMFTSFFMAASIVWDREFGFLREMLVAPVRRSAIVIGKCCGGATVAAMQGMIMLGLAGLVGVPYSPVLIVTLVAELLLLAFTLTAFGVMVAARIRSFPALMALSQMLLMPLFFLSGALFPLSGLPGWLQTLTHLNPLTYAIDPMRQAVFAHVDGGAAAARVFSTGVSWGGWPVPIALELAIVAAMGLVMLGIAILQFRHTE